MPEQSSAPMSGGGSTPRPDPTVLTNQLVDKATAGLKEVIETRLDGVDKILDQLQGDVRRRPHEIDVQINHLRELHDEKFHGVQRQFDERDIRVEQTSKDSKVAIDAALASAEKLVGRQNESFAQSVDKSERSTSKLLDQQVDQQKATALSLGDKITELARRLDRIEGAAVGVIATKTEVAAVHTSSAQSVGTITTIISVVVALALLAEKIIR